MTPVDVPLQPIASDVRINIANPPQLPTPPQPERSCCCWGRTFHHWTQYVLVGTGLGGGTVGLAAYLTQNLWLALVDAGIIVVGGVAIFVGIGCLVPQHDLEQQIEFYKQKLQESMELEQKLSVNIEEINKVKEELQQEVRSAKESVEELRKLLTQDMADFDKFATNIEVFQTQANGLVDLYKKFRDMFIEVKKQRDQTQKINKAFHVQIQELGGTIKTLEGNEEEFDEGVVRLDEKVKKIDKGNQALDGHLQELHEFGEGFQHQVATMKDQVGDLVAKVNLIDPEAWRNATKSVNDLKAVVAKLEQVTKKIE